MTVTWRIEDLQRIAPNARLVTGGEAERFAVDGLRPRAVIQPPDASEVAAALRFAAGSGLAVVPWGGGTAIDLGNPPARLDLVLDLSRLNRIVEHRPQDLTVTVEAGTPIAVLQGSLAEHGQMLALDPPLSDRATVGGVLAANGFGPRRLRYGTARDLVIGSRALLADGMPVRSGGKVVKNVAGYDLNKLWIGSCGTLAVITEATFKVMPVPAELSLVLAGFRSLEAAQSAATEVARSPLQPLSLDLIDPTAARSLPVAARAQPEADVWLLAVEAGGPRPVVERIIRELKQIAVRAGAFEVSTAEGTQRERFTQGLRDFGRSDDGRADWIVRVSVLPSAVGDTIAVVRNETRESPRGIIAQAGSGILFCFGGEAGAGRLPALVRELRRRIVPAGGSVVVERASPRTKVDLDVWGIEGPDRALMRRVKDAYDPAEILAPGRVV